MSYFLKNLKETITGFTETKKILRQERRLDDFNENTFSELLTVSNFSLKKLSIQFGEDLYFKIKNNQAVLLKPLKAEALFDLSRAKKFKNESKKKYKIIASRREPLLKSKDQEEDKCVDGVECFDFISKRRQCCKGFITEMLQKISYDLDFEFEIFLTSENLEIMEVVNNKMHMAVGSFRISNNFTNVIDYSNIFLYSGYGVIEKKNSKFETFLFLKPFPYLQWFLIIFISSISFISVSCLEFNSPFG